MSEPGFWSRLGSFLTSARIFAANALFVILLVFVLLALFSTSAGVTVPDNSALVLNLRGSLVDQRTVSNSLETLMLDDAGAREIEIGDLVTAVDRAAEDARIKMLVLRLDQLQAASAGHAATLGKALQRFSDNDKQVIAYGNYYTQPQYLIASFADAVYLHPMGQVLLSGFGGNQLYFKELLNKLDVNIHIFRVGRYKEFVEPYTRDDMSEDARVANQALVDALWSSYSEQILRNRQLKPEGFSDYTQNFPVLLARAGDMATAALEHYLVDELMTPDQVRARIADTVGYTDAGEINGIGFLQYLSATSSSTASADRVVGVITASGPVVTGRARGAIAADRYVELIREARHDDDLAALVLRINSPGGSSFASELIRQELELVQLAGKPVVVSMGNVAASGGYWIAATADQIIAEPTTITGSIGVFGILPTFERSLERLGVSTDGVATTPLSGADALSGLNEQYTRILQSNVEHTYQQFVNLVARGRDMTPADVDKIAQGRVWVGDKALELGLVDQLGALDEAIVAAAGLAQLETWEVKQLTSPVSARELLISQLTGSGLSMQDLLRTAAPALSGEATAHPLLRQLQGAWDLLNTLNDPGHSYALCEPCSLRGLSWRR